MPSSEHVYATLAVNRRCNKILPFVCFFLLLATNTAMVIYFGVVNKPIPMKGQPASQDPVVTTSGTRQAPTPVVKKTTTFEGQPASQNSVVTTSGTMQTPTPVVKKTTIFKGQPATQDPVVTTSGTTQTPTPGERLHIVCRCPDTWKRFMGSCYLFPDEPETFSDAEQFCQQHQSHLVKIDNSNENDFVKTHSYIITGRSRWIGLSDVAIEGEWVWTDGTKPSYLDWDQGEPNGHKTESCAMLFSDFQYNWNDAPCGAIYSPICERLSAC